MKPAIEPRVVRNPWHRPESPYSAATYTLKSEPLASHRGVDVYRHPASGILFVHGDMAITHRGKSDNAAAVIDAILDGQTPVMDAVARYLKEQGFSAVGWSQINELD